MSIAEFLLGRIADDEADAAADIQSGRADYGATEFEPDETIMRQTDPARILAECKAKRAIVEDHSPSDTAHDSQEPACAQCTRSLQKWRVTSSWDVEDRVIYPCDTIRAIASVYADYPDYREEWR